MSYACNGKPRPTSSTAYHAQDGWDYKSYGGSVALSRSPRIVEIKHVMSTDCLYQESATDKRCAGCQHIQKGQP